MGGTSWRVREIVQRGPGDAEIPETPRLGVGESRCKKAGVPDILRSVGVGFMGCRPWCGFGIYLQEADI